MIGMAGRSGLAACAAMAALLAAGVERAEAVSLQTIFRFDTVDTTRSPLGTQLGFAPSGALYGTLAGRSATVFPKAYSLLPPSTGQTTWTFGTLQQYAPGAPGDAQPKIDGLTVGCTPLSGAVHSGGAVDRGPDTTDGPMVIGLSSCLAGAATAWAPGDFWIWLTHDRISGVSDAGTGGWGLGVPPAADRPAGWAWWRGYGYAVAASPSAPAPNYAASWSGKGEYGKVWRDFNLGAYAGGLTCDLATPSPGTTERGVAPNYVAAQYTSAGGPTDPVIWFTTWATTKGGLPVASYASAGALWRKGSGGPCVLVARFQDPLGHPNGLAPDGQGGAYVTTTGDAWTSNAPLTGQHYGALYHWHPATSRQAAHLTLLRSFSTGDGGSPMPGLAKDAAGNFWGITSGYTRVLPNLTLATVPGQVFEVTPRALDAVTFAHTLAGGAEGRLPATQLVAGPGGWIYGATTDAHSTPGKAGGGSVFHFQPS